MIDSMTPESAIFTATAPSNIAFVKYWGKRNAEQQWPANDSLSMTLSKCKTITTARKIPGKSDVFCFEGKSIQSHDLPNLKVFLHLDRVRDDLRLHGALEISSKNLFPTSCGIASSASGFAALTLAATAALTGEHQWARLALLGISRARLAHLARLGSGSAGRSLHGGFVHWRSGTSPDNQEILQVASASQWNLTDVVVVFSGDKKHTSSTDAHKAAWGSPLFPARLAGIPQRIGQVISAIESRDIEHLGREIESDALEMHAVAMTGAPAVNYFIEDTVNFIAWVRRERATGNLPAWFSIDAGPNVHLLCETNDAPAVIKRVKAEWPNCQCIVDGVGEGPELAKGTLSESSREGAHV